MGDAGGWDTFLMLTFGLLFAVVKPIVRSVCLVDTARLLGSSVSIAGRLHRATTIVAAYDDFINGAVSSGIHLPLDIFPHH